MTVAAIASFLATAAAHALDVPARATGSDALIGAAERAPATIVAEIRNTRAFDRHGRGATVAVERALRGSAKPGAELHIAWEELASARAARFATGERVLLVLEALPGASIWRTRIPGARERKATLAIARNGDAFLQSPSLGTLSLLEHYLGMADTERAGPPGAGYLCELARRAEGPLARSAVARLAARSGLDAQLGAESAAALVAALLRPDERLTERLLRLIETQRLEATRSALEARASAQGPPAPPVVWDALARLPGGLASQRSERLLVSTDPQKRALGARHARGPRAQATLEGLLRRDREPSVRESAATRLASLAGEAAIEPLLLALSDDEARVRSAAVHGLASLGEPAIRPLGHVVDGNDPGAAASAIVALSLIPAPEAQRALAEFAHGHPDEAIRTLAKTALGRPTGHTH